MTARLIALVVLAVLAAFPIACSSPAASATAAPSPAPAVTPAKAAAVVNGETVTMDQVHEWLVEAYGGEAINQLIGTVVVEQAASREGVTISADDIRQENALTLEGLNPNLTADQYERVLTQLLARKGIPRIQWDASMRRNAYLRKMAARSMQITDAMVTDEFNKLYGMKVQIRVIQCASVQDAQKILHARAAGETFAELARKFSTLTESAREGGLIPPFSVADPGVPQAIRQSAFDLEDGQISGIIRVNKDFYLIQRVEAIAPETEVKFEDVKADLRKQIASRMMRQMQTNTLRDLMNRADVVLVDPLLKKQARLREAAQTGQ